MNTIISVWNSANKGKSETLRKFANYLLIEYPEYKLLFPENGSLPQSGDFRLIVEINGKIIGIESQGDPNTNLENRLYELINKFNCTLVFCTCRTKGETVYAVCNVANNKGFQSIWTSTYQTINKDQHQFLNDLKAKHLLDMVRNLNLL